MASETVIVENSATVDDPVASDATVIVKPRPPSKNQLLNKLYALPVPLRTYPLPTFIPHNPLSVFHILYTWISQTLFPPSSHPETLYLGWFSPETRSVHIADHKTARALWEQGFFGKGTLSRSEPNWLEKEKARQGAGGIETAEEYTKKRRAERQQLKWERARKEREAIEQKLEEERKAKEVQSAIMLQKHENSVGDEPRLPFIEPLTSATATTGLDVKPLQQQIRRKPKPYTFRTFSAPVGPTELLRLPNSDRDISEGNIVDGCVDEDSGSFDYEAELENTIEELETMMAEAMKGTDDADSRLEQLSDLVSGIVSNLPDEMDARIVDGEAIAQPSIDVLEETPQIPQILENVFTGSGLSTDSANISKVSDASYTNGSDYPHDLSKINGEPVTPKQQKSPKSVRFSPNVSETTFIKTSPPSPDAKTVEIEPLPAPITNQEHLQLSMEEAIFLSYGLGVLNVLDPATQKPLSTVELFRLCRQYSHFTPQPSFIPSPDDPFIISYVVYHHFRSLGWVVRGGIKFSVDWLLYARGPVFTHAEFAVLVLPSYSHAYWNENEERRAYVASKEKRDWHWLHCINRVNSQVHKTLLLVYVDIPPPIGEDEERELGITGVLGRYGVREIMVKRFLYNRQ